MGLYRIETITENGATHTRFVSRAKYLRYVKNLENVNNHLMESHKVILQICDWVSKNYA